MPRPRAASAGSTVDAASCAQSSKAIERRYTAADLPRLAEAGMRPESDSWIEAHFRFAMIDGHPAVDGSLRGRIVLTCQRCMQPARIELDEQFQVLVVREERADEPGGYEPIIADPANLDLRWLAEEQALLALPLVPMHEPQACEEAAARDAGSAQEERTEREEIRQQPFQNLRDLLRRG